MAAKKKTRKKKSGGTASFMELSMAAMQKHSGQRAVYVASEHERRHVGIPIPHLCLQWLLNSTVWPLQKITLSAGPPQSCKSAFAFEVQRWCLNQGGMVVHIDTESKLSYDLMCGLVGSEYVEGKDIRYAVAQAGSIEQWQQVVTGQFDALDEYTLENGEKPPFPLIVTIDAMTSVADEEALRKVAADGSSKGRTFSAAPLVLSTYMKTISDRILGYPVTLHLCNHEKERVAQSQFDKRGRYTPGGVAKDFHAAFDMRFKKTGSLDNRKAEQIQGNIIEISMAKNSFGPTIDRKLLAPFFWQFYTETAEDGTEGRVRQRFWWDWDHATAMLLSAKSSKIKSVMDIEIKTGRVGHRKDYLGWSSTLGIPEDSPILSSELGALVRENTELTTALQRCLGIRSYSTFSAGCLDYDDDEEMIQKRRASGKKRKDSDDDDD